MLRVSALGLVGLVFFGFFAVAEPTELTRSDFAVIHQDSDSEISFDDHLRELRKRLGDPDERIVAENESNSEWDEIVYRYDGLIISAYRLDKLVIYIQVESPSYSTARNITVGAEREAVVNAYGPPDYERENLIQYTFQPEQRATGYWLLNFSLEGNSVDKFYMNLSD
jgi:hypothetical protein